MRTPEDSVARDGYRFELAALAVGEETVATLTITNRGDSLDAPLFDVEFRSILPDDVAGENLRDRDVLPVPGDVRTVRVRFSQHASHVEVTVRFAEVEARLRTFVR